MFDLPLHPRLVHIPLGLLPVLPVVLAGLAFAIAKAKLPLRAWWVAVALAFFAAAGSFASARSGEEDEERVEHTVPEAALEAHEAAGERVVIAAGLLFAITLVGAFDLRGRTFVHAAAIAASLAALGLAVQAGHAGGELVYKHGAAAAGGENVAEDESGRRRRGHDDD